jgi:hypothetical protein
MSWIRRHPLIVNLVLGFAVALTAGLWTSLYASSTAQNPMSDRQHSLLIAALFLIGLQCWYNESTGRVEKKVINDLLGLGVRIFLENSGREIKAKDLRVMVHLIEKAKPGRRLPRQKCLVPRYYKSDVEPDDIGAIPIEPAAYKRWYVNVKAVEKQTVVCEEPNPDHRPPPEDLITQTPALFPSRSVISAPIWCRLRPNPHVVGTITFDSVHSAEELNWMKDGAVCPTAREMLVSLADLIGKIL